MKKSPFIIFLLISIVNCIQAQTPSSCTIPQQLINVYERDIKTLTMSRMYQLESPDTVLVTIPQNWKDTIAGGLAAIFNATSIPERDSVFNMYCVRAQTYDPTAPFIQLYSSYNEILIKVDTNFSWTQAWQNLNPITGNAYIDSLVVKYDLNISQFSNWSIGNYAIIQSDSLWNIYALIDSLELEPALSMGEANGLVGVSGAINYKKIGSNRYYDFSFQWNDCFDGCDNQHTWKFKVNADCSVAYLGFADWGYFSILPIPSPINCNLFTTIKENNIEKEEYLIFPNPVTDILTIKSKRNSVNSAFILSDELGREILKGNLDNETTTIDINHLAKGVYLFQVGQQIKQTFKVIKK